MNSIRSHITALQTTLGNPGSLAIDLLVVLSAVSIVGGIMAYGMQFSAPFEQKTYIDLSWSALPLYTFFSLCRGFAAYAVSLLFTLTYATASARSHQAERIMIPVLDVLQSIPVLGFLPGLVLGLVAVFPAREIGLEIACIIMIFTGQAWNMAFAYHASLKGIPNPLREAATMNGLSRWRTFQVVELPACMIGLVWNSMLSMAGGWFFLTVNEAFTLGDKDFRLPGIGSYMAEAINKGDVSAMIGAVVSMTVMIVAVDQLFWRPVVVWSERFKLEDASDANKPKSWFLDLLRESRLARAIGDWRRANPRTLRTRPTTNPTPTHSQPEPTNIILPTIRWSLIGMSITLVLWGTSAVLNLLWALPLQKSDGEDWIHVWLAVGATFLRTSTAIAIGGAWALPVGILIGLSPKWSQRLQPVVQVAASFPAPMLFPLVVIALVWLHIPFTIGCIALMVLGSQWYILFNVIAGAMSIPGDLKEVGTVMGTSKWRMWTRLYLPCVFPYFITGMVTAAGGAWNASIVSEFVQIKDTTHTAFGVGSLISEATAKGNFPLLTAGILAMAISVVLLNRAFWKRLFRIAEEKYALNT